MYVFQDQGTPGYIETFPLLAYSMTACGHAVYQIRENLVESGSFYSESCALHAAVLVTRISLAAQTTYHVLFCMRHCSSFTPLVKVLKFGSKSWMYIHLSLLTVFFLAWGAQVAIHSGHQDNRGDALVHYTYLSTVVSIAHLVNTPVMSNLSGEEKATPTIWSLSRIPLALISLWNAFFGQGKTDIKASPLQSTATIFLQGFVLRHPSLKGEPDKWRSPSSPRTFQDRIFAALPSAAMMAATCITIGQIIWENEGLVHPERGLPALKVFFLRSLVPPSSSRLTDLDQICAFACAVVVGALQFRIRGRFVLGKGLAWLAYLAAFALLSLLLLEPLHQLLHAVHPRDHYLSFPLYTTTMLALTLVAVVFPRALALLRRRTMVQADLFVLALSTLMLHMLFSTTLATLTVPATVFVAVALIVTIMYQCKSKLWKKGPRAEEHLSLDCEGKDPTRTAKRFQAS